MGNTNCDKCGHDTRMCECKKTFVAQVGGDHYQVEYQHWDWVTDIRMGYLPGNATKYVSRWRKKNGIADLEKAMTYIEKMIVIRELKSDYVFNHGTDYTVRVCTDRFVQSAGLTNAERDFVEVLTGPCDIYMLRLARNDLEAIIRDAKRTVEAVGPVGGGAGAGAGAMVPPAPAPSAAGGAMGQGPGASTSREPHNKSVEGMEHPFGYEQDEYDGWYEDDLHSIKIGR